MHITGEIPLGTVLMIVTIITIAARFSRRLNRFETQVKDHAGRMDRYEERYGTIARDVQRIIGRMDDQDRSPWPRNRRSLERTQ